MKDYIYNAFKTLAEVYKTESLENEGDLNEGFLSRRKSLTEKIPPDIARAYRRYDYGEDGIYSSKRSDSTNEASKSANGNINSHRRVSIDFEKAAYKKLTADQVRELLYRKSPKEKNFNLSHLLFLFGDNGFIRYDETGKQITKIKNPENTPAPENGSLKSIIEAATAIYWIVDEPKRNPFDPFDYSKERDYKINPDYDADLPAGDYDLNGNPRFSFDDPETQHSYEQEIFTDDTGKHVGGVLKLGSVKIRSVEDFVKYLTKLSSVEIRSVIRFKYLTDRGTEYYLPYNVPISLIDLVEKYKVARDTYSKNPTPENKKQRNYLYNELTSEASRYLKSLKKKKIDSVQDEYQIDMCHAYVNKIKIYKRYIDKLQDKVDGIKYDTMSSLPNNTYVSYLRGKKHLEDDKKYIEDKKSYLEKQLEDLKNQLAATEKQINALTYNSEDKEEYDASINNQLNEVADKYEEISAEIKKYNDHLNKVKQGS